MNNDELVREESGEESVSFGDAKLISDYDTAAARSRFSMIGFAFAISVVLNIVATSIFFSPLMIILYHLLWAGLSLIMTRKK